MFSIRCREKRGQLDRKNISILLCGQLTPGLTVFSQNIPALVKDVMKHLSGEEPRTNPKPVSQLLIERESIAERIAEGQG